MVGLAVALLWNLVLLTRRRRSAVRRKSPRVRYNLYFLCPIGLRSARGHLITIYISVLSLADLNHPPRPSHTPRVPAPPGPALKVSRTNVYICVQYLSLSMSL